MKSILKKIYSVLLIVSLLATHQSIAKQKKVKPQVPEPQVTFEAFWKLFNNHYGLFKVKKLNWDSVGNLYRNRVTATTSEEELYQLFGEMILLLGDNHVNLYPTTATGFLPVFPGGLLKRKDGVSKIYKVQEDYSAEAVKKYVQHWKDTSPNVHYGMLNGNIGYININGTDAMKTIKKIMPRVLTELQACKAIVVDVRAFYGGMDAVSQYIAGCFANERKSYLITKKRNGENTTDFTHSLTWYVQPQPMTYTGQVVVLSSVFTQSAGETFLLAMHELSNVRVLGDTTAGSYSDNPTFELPNGWMISLSVGDYRAANGKSYEGIGTAPDEYKVATKIELLQGKDVLLEYALQYLNR
ncbi:MAG: S41 family peptidase [Bacteroidetes bacterium]|nr:S41 family peptidase [Bacteroidota bacterium]